MIAAQCLERECREEMGVGCRVLDRLPRFAWSAPDKEGIWRVVLCYAIELESFDFSESLISSMMLFANASFPSLSAS